MMGFGSVTRAEVRAHDLRLQELGKRSHELANNIGGVRGEVLSLKVAVDERLKSVDAQQTDTKNQIAAMALTLNDVRDRVTKLDAKQLGAVAAVVFLIDKIPPGFIG